MQRNHTLFLVPDLIGQPGGIARVCSFVCRALTEEGKPLTTVALHDLRDASGRAQQNFPGMVYLPCNGSRLRFVTQMLIAAFRKRPAIVFAAHPYFSYLTYVAARLAGARSIVMIHGTDAWETLSLPRRWGLRKVDVVLSVSRFTAQKAIEANGLNPETMRILHNCVDPELTSLSVNNTSPNGALLLTVARINRAESKGHEVVIAAMPELVSRFPGLKYSIVGDGDGRESLELSAVRQGVAEAVKFHGTVSESELMRLYGEATVFVMPSRGEGFGLAFIEAMFLGKPAIGGSLDASPEVIVDGETGYIVDPASTTEIVDRVSRLLSDLPLREEMGRQAALHVRRSFGYAAFKNKLLNYLFAPQTSEAKPGDSYEHDLPWSEA